MKLNGLRIKCIGFSVTTFGKPNYTQVMQNYFDERGVNVEVTHGSVGGLSVDSLPYLLESILKKDQADLVILEIATSWFSLIRKNENEADKYLELIVNYIESMNSSILFLNMYRKDIDDNDIIIRSINKYAKNKYPVIDFKSHFRKLLNESGDDGTIDGVHPKQEIINWIAKEICKKIFEDVPNYLTHISELKNPFIYHINTFNLLEQDAYIFDNHSGLTFECRKIHQGEKIIISTEQKIRISGIFYLMGPDTNQLELYLDDMHINIPMRDSASYYRRLGYRYLGVHECTKITLEHPIEYLDVNLTREPWEKVESLCNYVVGFSSHI
jgi:lysophospholipase L1-like esterase